MYVARWYYVVRLRLRSVFRRGRVEADLEEELQFHVARETEANLDRGLRVTDAEAAARRTLGRRDQVKEACRDARGMHVFESCRQETRYAFRVLRHAPGFAAATIATLALGIGATTATFSVVYGVLLRPLPYRAPESTVVIQTRDRLTGRVTSAGFSGPDLADWTERTRVFDALALSSLDIVALDSGAGADTLHGAFVSPRFFDILGARMAIGRPLGNPRLREIVIGSRLWHRQFGGEPGAVGRRVRLNGTDYTIVGVAPSDFQLPIDTRRSVGAATVVPDLWAPMALAPRAEDRRARYYHLIARLRAGVTMTQAAADAERVARSVAADASPGRAADPVVMTLAEYLTGRVRRPLLLLLGAVGLVLLVACANVTSLLLARQLSRAREHTVRTALGAPRSRLLLQSMIECLWLVLGGSVGGVILAYWTVFALRSLDAVDVPRMDAIHVDLPVLLLTGIVAAALVTVSGLIAALPLLRRNGLGHVGLAPHAPVDDRLSRRVRSAIVTAEFAVSFILLVSAALLARSFLRLVTVDLGARTDQVVAVEVNLAMGRSLSTPQQMALTDRLLERMEALPGVVAVGAANGLPPNRTRMMLVFEEAQAVDGRSVEHRLTLLNPTPGYLDTLGIPLLRGRYFTRLDSDASQRVVILGAGAARHLFRSLDVIGRTLETGSDSPPTIVGVVGDVKYSGLDAPPGDTVYQPFAQYPFRNMTLVARTTDDPLAAAAAMRQAIRAVDRAITMGPIRRLDDVVADTLVSPRFRTMLGAALAMLALGLTALGLGGVIAYGVARRTVEIGIRRALGARPLDVVMRVMREGLVLAMIGTVIGSAGAYGLTRLLASLLYDVQSTDGISFALSGAFLVAATLIASYVPARRAASVDPIRALRVE